MVISTRTITPTEIDGHRLKAALNAATLCLQRYSNVINALNVFPVPDGDTGTNMLLTMQSVKERLEEVDSASLSTVASEAARGALFGARGNSGVIFSQFLAGFAEGLKDVESADPDTLANALATGSEASYAAVSQPVEGTMLTVLRGFAEGASDRSVEEEDVLGLWNSALEEAKDALAKTPTMLPVLRDAGVIDSGGQGVVVIMEGFLCSFLDEDPNTFEIELSSPTSAVADMPVVSQEFLEATESEEYGFCTEFLIEGENIDVAGLRSYLSEKGSSLIVIGDSTLVKVHIHTLEPDELIAHGATLGNTMGVKVDDISAQHQGFLSLHAEKQDAPALAVVAVAWGPGFISLFDDLGCHAIVPCQRTMNPSTEELLEAARATGAEDVVILPNNSNVVLTARQASRIAEGTLHVIPTRSQTQGIAALLSYVPELPRAEVLEAMEESIEDLQTVEVTTAHRDTIMDGKAVSSGQVIGLLEGDLCATGEEIPEVAHRAILAAKPESGAVVTLYWGGDVEESEALTTARRLEDAIDGLEVETVYGGQPFYHYIASIE